MSGHSTYGIFDIWERARKEQSQIGLMAKVQKGTGKTEFCLQGIGHGNEYEYS